jgi:hypothetical protein
MKAYEIMKKQKVGTPKNPSLGQLYYEPYTKTMRVWTGKGWRETNAAQMASMIGKFGSLAKWIDFERCRDVKLLNDGVI